MRESPGLSAPAGGLRSNIGARTPISSVSPRECRARSCCAVGLANLDVFDRERLVERAATLGARLQEKAQMLRSLPSVGDVRGLGLMCGVELVADKTTKAPALGVGAKVLREARRRGLITRMRTGQVGEYPIGDTICIAPPLVVTEQQVDRIIDILRE